LNKCCLLLHYRFNNTTDRPEHSGYNLVDCSADFWRCNGGASSAPCEGADPLEDGFAPADTTFLSHVPWKVGLPLFWSPGDSGEAWFFEVRPAINLYATLLAFTISVLACRNWETQSCNKKNHVRGSNQYNMCKQDNNKIYSNN
jgi:hypothetical protein